MKNWTKMTAADFGATDGAQLGLFATDDGHGTISLDEIATEVETAPVVVDLPERADGALFGLALSDVPADGALFSVVAA